MAEGNAEDSPLLGGAERQPCITSTAQNTPSDEEEAHTTQSTWSQSHPQWAQTVQVQQHWQAQNVNVQPQWAQQMSASAQQMSVSTPKSMHSQISMDSGCDCDGDGSLSAPNKSNESQDSEPPTPGPSLCSGPQKYICDSPYEDKDKVQSSKVTFRIEGEEGEQAQDDRETDSSAGTLGQIEETRNVVRITAKPFPRITSFSKAGMLSASSSTASMPMCRICHLPQGEGLDMLISPCRCAGTMQFIHEGCLMKWLEISSKRIKRAPTCELCNYQFNRHKKFRLRHWKLPSCSFVDKILHIVFLICILIMATSATITIYCFKQDRFTKNRKETDLTRSEIITLTCGVLFFVAFFIAMYVEVKAKDTLYRLFSRFIYLNQTWHIHEYDKRKDIQAQAPV